MRRGPKKHLSGARITIAKAMAQVYDSGETLKDVAQLFDCHPNTVAKYLDLIKHPRRSRGNNVKGRTRGRPPVPEQTLQMIADKYRSGMTMQQIGDELGFTREWISQCLDRKEVPRNSYRYKGSHYRLPQEEWPEVAAAYEPGSLGKLANRFSVSAVAIKRILESQGVEVYKKIPSSMLPRLAERYHNGESANALANDMGCSASAMASRLKRFGVRMRTRSEAVRRYWDEVEHAAVLL